MQQKQLLISSRSLNPLDSNQQLKPITKKERKLITSSLLFYHYSNHYSLSYQRYHSNLSNYSSLSNIPPLPSIRIRLSSIPQSLLIFHTRHYLNLSAGSLSCYLLSSLESKRSEVSLLGGLSQNPQSVIYSTQRIAVFGTLSIWE